MPGYPSVESWFAVAPDWTWGWATFYNPGIMQATADYRGLSLNGYLGGVAMMTCSEIGGAIWIRPIVIWKDRGYDHETGEWEGPYRVVDCARRGDLYGVVVHRNEVVEVDHETAKRWGMVWPDCVDGLEVYESQTKDGCVLFWRMMVQVSKIEPKLLPDPDLFYPVPAPGQSGDYSRPVQYREWFLGQLENVYRYDRNPVYYPGVNTWLIDGEIVDFLEPKEEVVSDVLCLAHRYGLICVH